MSGPSSLTYLEIKAWCDLMGNTLSAWEVDIIKQIDAIYMKVVNSVRH